MSLKFGKAFIKALDNLQSGFLTINKILVSSNNFKGVHSNILIDEYLQKAKTNNETRIDNKINKHQMTSDCNQKQKDFVKTESIHTTKPLKKIIEPTPKINIINDLKLEKVQEVEEANMEFPQINNEQRHNTNEKSDDSFLIKSDKLNFVGKQSRIPVTPMSRALNFGVLGVTMIGSGLTSMVIDKVKYN